MRQRIFETASLTVRLGRITGNYRIMGRLAGGAAVAAVVKADGYGLGAKMVAPALQAARRCGTQVGSSVRGQALGVES